MMAPPRSVRLFLLRLSDCRYWFFCRKEAILTHPAVEIWFWLRSSVDTLLCRMLLSNESSDESLMQFPCSLRICSWFPNFQSAWMILLAERSTCMSILNN